MDAPKEIFLKDYKLPDYYFDTVDLSFLLGEEKTTVSAKISVVPRVDGTASPLVLDGVDLKLISVKINGRELKEGDYNLESRHLILTSPPSGNFILETVTEILPQKNTSLEGLYKSSGNFCTQCEAESFRKITFYQDRPDIMAKYTCRIEADKSQYPVLLSNGNLIEQGELEGGNHFALWEDPFKKPCYLFALVAGQLESRDDTFTTSSGRTVNLKIWSAPQDLPKTEHAMYSLKAAMKWDEDVFGREYDLDIFNIVSVPDFNMGAMENKSLNIFNSMFVLASPETARDADYAAILGVIGHEYFHNWTGNRVTCRDWFQLSLKEGLTVFRDQEFSSDLGSTVKRISDVSMLRTNQFSEDAGPMAHPIRPHSYIKMDNFYTATVYVKGAEVVRMYKTLLGSQGFRKGMDLYFQRHDGQAVTCEDFVAAMRDANNADFANFLLWYSQAGTPVVKVTSSYNAEARTFSLKFSQTVPPTPGQPVKEPMFIPVAAGLLDSSGKDMPLSSIYHDGKLESVTCGGQPVYTTILRVTKGEEEFIFSDVPQKPIPSLLRGYSAPIRLQSDLTDSDLFFLLAHDSDEFNRWEAGQILARKLMLSQVVNFQKSRDLVLDPQFVHGIRCVLLDSSLDKELIAKAITLPSEGEIMDMMDVADPDAVHAVRKFIRKQLASELKQELLNLVKENRSTEKYVFDHTNMARRSLKNTALGYLASLEDEEITELVLQEYKTATNMTDQFSALAAIAQKPGKARDDALADFYNQWQHDYVVVNKWFALQSSSDIPGNVENVYKLLSHQAFDLKNPNKVYSVIGGFCASLVNFHKKDGSGYKFLGEMVVQLDKLNPQVAADLVSDFSRWKRYDETRQNLAKDAGPMAHPIRPHSYIKMDNFYTATVYVKGAEVVRMYKTLLGSQGFRKGMDLYFQRHDGQAVTCEDFFAAMRDANNADFANFLLWYSQAGTPVVKVTSSYNAEARTFSLKFSQTVPPTPGQPVKEPMFIPVAAGLLDSSGKNMPLSSIYHDGKLESVTCGGQPVYTTILRVTKGEEEFIFSDVPQKPIPSLLRGYSAPIRLQSDLTDSDLFFLLAHDSDEFNRWEAGQILARKLMLSQVVNFQKSRDLVLDPQFVHGIKCVLLDSSLDKEFIAKAISLPSEGEIMDMMDVADPDAVHAVRKFIRKQLASQLKQELLNLVKENRSTEKYVFDHTNMARRALKNTALGYLASLEDEEITELVLQEYKTATNMTDQFSALAAIAQKPGKARDDALADFYNQWQHDYVVVNKWFALQSSSDIPGNVQNVYKLLSHQAFDLKNPNKVYSVIGGFCASLVNFHKKDGSGYKFLGEMVVQLDKLNPQVAADLVSDFSRWKRYDETRQNLAKAQLEMIVSADGLSENVYEIASKSLAG